MSFYINLKADDTKKNRKYASDLRSSDLKIIQKDEKGNWHLNEDSYEHIKHLVVLLHALSGGIESPLEFGFQVCFLKLSQLYLFTKINVLSKNLVVVDNQWRNSKTLECRRRVHN